MENRKPSQTFSSGASGEEAFFAASCGWMPSRTRSRYRCGVMPVSLVATKVGSGIGSAVLGILIGMAGYDGNLTVQPGSAITMIRLLYSLIPAVMYICVFIMLRFFKLEKMLPTVRKVNEENRKKAEEGAAQEAPEA